MPACFQLASQESACICVFFIRLLERVPSGGNTDREREGEREGERGRERDREEGEREREREEVEETVIKSCVCFSDHISSSS